MDNILLIIILITAVWYRWDTQRSNEIALHACRQKCSSAGLQLLDATVTRQRTWLRKGPAGLQICRLYSFEYSDHEMSDYGGRDQGYIVLIGDQVVETNLPN